MTEKQYAAFAADIKSLDTLRRGEAKYVPGVFEVTKVIVLSNDDFSTFSEDMSPDYPFLKDNAGIMSVGPGGMFRCITVRAESDKEHILIAGNGDNLYFGHGRDYSKVNLKGVPVEHITLIEPKAYVEHASFYHRPGTVWDLNGQVPEHSTSFKVEKVVILSDGDYVYFKEWGLTEKCAFLFENRSSMWFDPEKLCWHCLLVKGATSTDGILVEAEGYSYSRYAAFVPDCGRLLLRDVPVQYEYPARPPEKSRSNSKPER